MSNVTAGSTALTHDRTCHSQRTAEPQAANAQL